MSYTKRFDPSRYDEIVAITAKVMEMTPGEKLSLSGWVDTEDLGRIRSLLYDWFYHSGLKSRFVLKAEDSTLTIKRKGLPPEIQMAVEKPSLEPFLQDILTKMIVSDSPLDLAKEYHEQGKLSYSELGQLLAKYEEVMS